LDPLKVVAQYSDQFTFLPTLSPNFIVNDKIAALAYFTAFLKKFPSAVITEFQVQIFSDVTYLYSGKYTFTLGPSGNRALVKARFSMIWQYIDGSWLIIHHHSSLLPPTPTQNYDHIRDLLFI